MRRGRFARYRGGMLAVVVVSILVCSIDIAALQTGTAFAHVRQSVPSNTAVLTYKDDASRTGLNPNETILTTGNVNVSQFGKRISYSVDGQVYAQPLYAPNLTMGSSTLNVVFVATEHDSVYAFDADQTSFSRSSNFLWHTSFINPPNVTTVSSTDVNCTDLTPEIGITSTPVIDLATNTIYVVATTKESGAIVYRLHALDITTGKEEPGSPTLIQASVTGTGAGSSNGQVPFTPKQERQRTALLLANGTIYIGWAGYCDNPPYHGSRRGRQSSTQSPQRSPPGAARARRPGPPVTGPTLRHRAAGVGAVSRRLASSASTPRPVDHEVAAGAQTPVNGVKAFFPLAVRWSRCRPRSGLPGRR